MDFKTMAASEIIHNKELRNAFVKVYNDSGLGQLAECDNCNGAFENAINKYQKKYVMGQKEYELLPNKVLHFEGKDYVNANLTDEVAAAAVKSGYSALFKRAPLKNDDEIKETKETQNRQRKNKR